MIRNFRGNHVRCIVPRLLCCTVHHSNQLTTNIIPKRKVNTSCERNLRLSTAASSSIKHRAYHKSRPLSLSVNITLNESDESLMTPSLKVHDTNIAIRHDYIQAPNSGPIIGALTEGEIHDYLAQRLIYMTTRDAEQLRKIDDTLEYANVFVDDLAKQWRADGKRFVVYQRRKPENTPPINGSEEEQLHIKNAYYRSPYIGTIVTNTLSESEIHTLLAERHYLRRIRNYESADIIRKKLESHGIFIDDIKRKWYGDGTNLFVPTHNYTMSRDSGPWKSLISEEEIHDMISKRHRCRLRKDYKGADTIFQKLIKCGVSIDDELMEWRADGIQFSKFLRRHEYTLVSDAGHNIAKATENDIHHLLAQHWSHHKAGETKKADHIWDELSNIGVFLDVTTKEWRADGIKHNYRLSPNAGMNVSKLSDKVIHDLLEQRMIYRWRRNFKESDLIRDKLKYDGIYIDDVNKEWRADGNGFHHLCHKYKSASDMGPLIATLPENIIHKLLSEFWQWQLAHCFDKADAIYDDLFQAGVYVNDKKEIWRGDGKTCNFQVIPWSGPFQTNSVSINELQMHRLLEENFRSRLRQQYDAANHVQDQLYQAGIFLDLDTNMYRADGIMHAYKKSPVFNDPSLSNTSTPMITEKEIHRLIAERWQYKISQNFAGADRIFDELYDSGVFVDDETMEYRMDGIFHTYRMTSNAGIIKTSLPIPEIHTLIGKRIRHKKFKDFDKADVIMKYLRSARVYMDDKKKEWRADGIQYDNLKSKRQKRKRK